MCVKCYFGLYSMPLSLLKILLPVILLLLNISSSIPSHTNIFLLNKMFIRIVYTTLCPKIRFCQSFFLSNIYIPWFIVLFLVNCTNFRSLILEMSVVLRFPLVMSNLLLSIISLFSMIPLAITLIVNIVDRPMSAKTR